MKLPKNNSPMESNFIKVYDNVFSETICSQLVDAVNEKNERIEKDRKPNFYQRNIGREPEYSGLYQNFGTLGMKYLSDLGYEDNILPLKYGFEELRIKKYEVGDSFDKHIDVADYASAKRWVAFLVYLNDDFEGGETQFYIPNQTIKPKRGSVLVFPPLWLYPHAGLPVTKGEKYILTTYFHLL
jgi:hypothetical protein